MAQGNETVHLHPAGLGQRVAGLLAGDGDPVLGERASDFLQRQAVLATSTKWYNSCVCSPPRRSFRMISKPCVASSAEAPGERSRREERVKIGGQPGNDWTGVLRRWLVRMIEDQPGLVAGERPTGGPAP